MHRHLQRKMGEGHFCDFLFQYFNIFFQTGVNCTLEGSAASLREA